MARKKTEPKIFVPASLADAKWINTPFAYARLAKDLTLLQQNVLLKVSDQLQDYITDFFRDGRNLSVDDPNSLFTPEVTASLPRLEIRLSDFGIDKSRYGEIHIAANAVSDLRIKAPNIQDDGTVNGYRMFPVFDEVVVPKTDESASDEDKYNYRTGIMYASINPKVAAYAFNMRLGYINHPVQIAADANQVYSPRIYFMIKHYLPKNKMSVVIPYDKIREDVGMIVIDNETGEQVDELYPQFSRFRTYVLDKAKEDIKRMADRNLIDITFDYEPIYRGNNNRGNPDSIEFKITLTELGKFHKLPRAAKAAIKTNEQAKRRGRPRKVQPDDGQDIFANVPDEPQLIPNDRVGEWLQLVSSYGDGPSTELLTKSSCQGTIDGAFSITMPDYQSKEQMVEAAANDERLKSLLQNATGRQFKTIQIGIK